MEFYKARKIQSTYTIIIAGDVGDAARSINFEFQFPYTTRLHCVIISTVCRYFYAFKS